ncbi:MAG: tol-pal system-associated acyl-CoA thioesterase [Burkholderiaceae bacterium]
MPKPFNWTIRVYYEDTDTCGVVYYANYLKFFERARTEWLRALGFDQQEMADQLGLRFIISRIECEYRQPARLDDVIEVDVRVARAGGASIVFEQAARRGAEVLATARVRAGCVDAERLTPVPMPQALIAALEQSTEVIA